MTPSRSRHSREEEIRYAIELAATRQIRAMWKRAKFAADVADAIYRAYRNHDDAVLTELSPVQQMRFHAAAERAITALLLEDARS